jgi:polysaccharide deacetylase family protein (PEP-CTERM system associated)
MTIRNAMTVDVEDYFQVQAFAGVVSRSRWNDFTPRVGTNVARILDRFAAAGVHATFFTLGWVAERHPGMVRRIVAEGHELASHGYGHALVHTLDASQFRADVSRARKLLEDIAGVAVTGYRAPTFSLGVRTPWAFAVLAEEGYRYSSSTYPIRHDLYGEPDAPRFPYHPDGGPFVELPLTTVPIAGHNLPFAGGGYFRLLPYRVFRSGLARLNRRERRPGIFYFHPWEIDPGQPRIRGAGSGARFRHYLNLAAMPRRLDRLLGDFAWDRIDAVFADLLTASAPARLAEPAAA